MSSYSAAGSSHRIAFVCGLSDKKLAQKLAPLQAREDVQEIHLFRRERFAAEKVVWMPMPGWVARSSLLGDMWRLVHLLASGYRYTRIIGCHQRFHGVMACVCGLVWRKPVIQMVIAGVDWVEHHTLYRRSVLAAQACAVRGKTSHQRLRQLGYTGRIATIANPYQIPAAKLEPAQRKVFDLVSIASFAEAKDYPWMMHVLARIKRSLPQVQLAIVGDGPYEAELHGLLERYQLRENITFLGWQEESGLARVLRQSRALILTSSTEGLPMVVLEAMSYCLPVFVTGVGELPWLVRHGIDGVVADHGDTQGMSEAIVRALIDEDALQRFGHSARQRVEEFESSFELGKITREWDILLNSGINKNQ